MDILAKSGKKVAMCPRVERIVFEEALSADIPNLENEFSCSLLDKGYLQTAVKKTEPVF